MIVRRFRLNDVEGVTVNGGYNNAVIFLDIKNNWKCIAKIASVKNYIFLANTLFCFFLQVRDFVLEKCVLFKPSDFAQTFFGISTRVTRRP